MPEVMSKKNSIGQRSLILHVGYSKAMSSWLQVMFRNMTDVCYAEKTKYLSSFSRSLDIDRYLDQFTCKGNDEVWVESDEHLILPGVHPNREVAITNLDLTDSLINRIKSLEVDFAQTKIIVVLRNQVDMLISRYIQYVRGQGGSISPSKFLEEMVFHDRHLEFMDYRYSFVIDHFSRTFGSENVLVLLQEQAKEDIGSVVDKLVDFVGGSFDKTKMQKEGVNVSPSRRAIQVERWVNWLCLGHECGRSGTAMDRFRRLCALYSCVVVEKFDSVLSRSKQKELIFSGQEKQQIMNIFQEDNERLGDNLELDLTRYGY